MAEPTHTHKARRSGAPDAERAGTPFTTLPAAPIYWRLPGASGQHSPGP